MTEKINWQKVSLLLVIASALAIFEIQIEGAAGGWAKNLPCWRAGTNSWQQTIYGLAMNGKPCDGFHLSEVFLLLAMFHLPFVYGAKWNWSKELEILTGFFTMAVIWDFLWFELNPAFGWAEFDAAHIWWHSRWLGPFPQDYYGGLALAILLAIGAGGFNGGKETTKRILGEIRALIGLTAAVAIVAEIIRHWYS